MKILVTGGAGFIGSHIVDALIVRKHHVTVVDDLSTGKRSNLPQGADLIREDIRSPRLKDIFRDVRPEMVFHLVAQKNIRTSVDEPILDADINITGSLQLIDLSHRFGVKRFIFSSSGGAIYGAGSKYPTQENEPPRPLSPYGIAKYTIEQYLDFYAKFKKLSTISLRYANVYGPRQDPKGEAGVVAIFAKSLLQKVPLIVYGNGRQTRDYVYVEDIVRANLLASRSRVTGEYNIGTGREISVLRLAQTMSRIAQSKSAIKHRRVRPGELQRSVLNAKRAKKDLRWQPTVDLTKGLNMTWEWMKGQYV